jgi:hypothetical protein
MPAPDKREWRNGAPFGIGARLFLSAYVLVLLGMAAWLNA